MDVALVVAVVVLALALGCATGYLDAPATIATSLSTRALTPRTAVAVTATATLVGALLGQGVAETVGSILVPGRGTDGLVVVLAAVLGALGGTAATWRSGLPSSSTHALVGGLLGAGLASAATVQWAVVLERVVLPTVLAPLLAGVLAHLVGVGVLWAFRHSSPGRSHRRFRAAQAVSTATVALGHGLQDAQKVMGVVVLALLAGGSGAGGVPLWVQVAAALAIGAGAWVGGRRAEHRPGRRAVDVDPPRGFAAEAVAAGVLHTCALAFAAPVSTTHTLTAAVVGAGATRRLSAVRWGVVVSTLAGWALTVPASAGVAALVVLLLSLR